MIEMLIIAVFGIILFVFGFMFGKMDKEAERVQKPLEIEYTYHKPKKWVACKRFSKSEYSHIDDEKMDRIAVSSLTEEFQDIIKDHMTKERDFPRYEVIYRVEMWID